MSSTRRRATRGVSAVLAAIAAPVILVAPASALDGYPQHAAGHGWAPVNVCKPAGKAPYTYTIRVTPLSSIHDGKGYVAFANRTYKYYQFRDGQFRVTDAPAKPTEVGGLHYAAGHNGDELTAKVVSGPRCA